MKHPRDALDDEDTRLSKIPRNRCEYNLDNLQGMIFFLFRLLIMLAITCTVLIATSPAPIPTESLDSPREVYASGQQKNPFQACEVDDGDEDEDSTTADDGEEVDVLLPDNTDQAYQFSATLDGIDVAIGFQPLFTAVKKKKVYIHDIDQAL